MSPHVCSLYVEQDQTLPANTWTTVRYPFGATENTDTHGMHEAVQPDGYTVTNYATDDRSGLIWPSVEGWAIVTCKVNLSGGNYSQVLGQFLRGQDGVGTGRHDDWTGTEGKAPTPGGEHYVWNYQLQVTPGEPLAFQIRQYGTYPVQITHSQYKMAILPYA